MRNVLSKTFDLVHEFSCAQSVEDVNRILLSQSARFGVDRVLAGVIPRSIVRSGDQPGYVVFGHWPDEWAQRYFERQYVRRDKTILHCAEASAPLVWSEIEYGHGDDAARRIMDEARDFRLFDGLTIPHLTIDGARIGVSFSGERIDRSPRSLEAMTILAGYAVNRALQIRASTWVEDVHLTLRERECLLWLGEGKTYADTAAILRVSVKAVEKYLASAREKLNALTSLQAIATAMRLGLLG